MSLEISEIVKTPNLVDLLDDKTVRDIGEQCLRDFDTDMQSRGDWDERNADALKLALQVREDKSFPWQGAANVKFPLLSIAALQYHSRAYPALVQTDRVVKAKVWADDPNGELRQRAERISKHMSWQLTEQDYDWEDETDTALLIQPIIGCVFRKVYYRADEKRNESELILPDALIVNYGTTKISASTRVTHIIEMPMNRIVSRQRQGVYADVDLSGSRPTEPAQSAVEDMRNERQGTIHPFAVEGGPRTVYEQHTEIDLDDDGYAEPYIVTLDYTTREVLRIVARFSEHDVRYNAKQEVEYIEGECYFVKYPFIPSPDGGFYDIGFGALLGPINETVNTAINQILDAGAMATVGGGFIGRGIRIIGGNLSFRPGEWKRLDSSGQDLKGNLVPLPTREPSNVLLQMLSMLINYSERLSGATDLMTGITPGQNTPAETSRAAMQEASRVFSGILKRTWRAMKTEYRMLFRLNQHYLDVDPKAMLATRMVRPGDYTNTEPTDIVPGANPDVAMEQQRLAQAQTVLQLSQTTPGFNRDEAMLRFLQELHVQDIPSLYVGTAKGQPLPNPKVQVEQMKQQGRQQIEQAKLQANMQLQMAKLQQQAALIKSEIDKNEAQAALFMEQAGGVKTGHEIAAFDALIGAQKDHHKSLLTQIQMMHELAGEHSNAQQPNQPQPGADHQGGLPTMEGPSGNAMASGGTPPAG